MDEDLLRSLPPEYAALADRRRVMLEVAEELADLRAAVTHLGDALERAGLPGREWRSRDAGLRLLARKLPDITVDALMTRLAEFAAGEGPALLRGSRPDLERFHDEVGALFGVIDRLQRIAARRAQSREQPRGARPIDRAFATSGVAEALDQIASMLGDFRALEPFMAPLDPSEWGPVAASRSVPASLDFVNDSAQSAIDDPAQGRGLHGTQPLPASQARTRLRDFARATGRPDAAGKPRSRKGAFALWPRALPALPARLLRRQWLIALGAVLVLMTLAVVLTLHAQHAPPSPVDGAAATSVASTQTAQSGPALAPTATALPSAHPTATRAPTATAAPAPKVSLSCTSQGTSATLSIKNVGKTSLNWKASGSGSLSVSPSQGQLSAGQTTNATVTANGKRRVSGTVTVVAASGGTSATYSVTC